MKRRVLMSDLGLCLWVVRHTFLSAHQAANAIQAHFSQDKQHKRSKNIHDALRCLNAHQVTQQKTCLRRPGWTA